MAWISLEGKVIEVRRESTKGSQLSKKTHANGVGLFAYRFSIGGLGARIPPTGQGGKAVHGRTALGIRGEVTQGKT